MNGLFGTANLNRRHALKLLGSAGLAAGVSSVLGTSASYASAADIEGSKKEGKFVWYTPVAPEDGLVKLLAAFKTKYPWVDVSEFLRLQTGKLYPKIVEEMRQGLKICDVLTLSEVALTDDFEKQGYWEAYESPELATFPKEFKSPNGLWGSSWITYQGIAWNPNNVKDADAPKKWSDLLDPKWAGKISVKDSNSGSQYAQYVALKQIYGDEYWTKFAAQKPIVLAGQQPQYDRIISGDDLINGGATSSAYSLLKRKGAPVNLVFPEEGVPVVGLQTGIVKNAAHPHTARLFIDFLFSEEGQKASVDLFSTHSPRPGVAGPEFLPPAEQIKAIWPTDLKAYIEGQAAWREYWKTIGGA